MLNHAKPLPHNPWQTLRIECLPNRDSTIYKDIYNIEGCDSIFRGTLRYGGFSKIMYGFKKLGLMVEEPCGGGGGDWAGVIRDLIGEQLAKRRNIWNLRKQLTTSSFKQLSSCGAHSLVVGAEKRGHKNIIDCICSP